MSFASTPTRTITRSYSRAIGKRMSSLVLVIVVSDHRFRQRWVLLDAQEVGDSGARQFQPSISLTIVESQVVC